jgi:hypothetical protein
MIGRRVDRELPNPTRLIHIKIIGNAEASDEPPTAFYTSNEREDSRELSDEKV